MRNLLPEIYAYESTYEIIRRRSAARTPAEMKFYGLLIDMAKEQLRERVPRPTN
jgi:hypothetical protein